MGKKINAGLIILLLFTFVTVGIANATILDPFPNYTSLLGTNANDNTNLAGSVVENEITEFSFGSITGFVKSSVTLSTDGTYDFYWQIINNNSSSANIGSFRIAYFYSTVYDANFRNDLPGDVGPNLARPSSLPGFVNFEFSNGLAPGQESKFFFFDTDATNYNKSAFYDLTGTDAGGSISVGFETFAPGAPVPEPTTMVLFGLGLLGLAGVSRKKQK